LFYILKNCFASWSTLHGNNLSSRIKQQQQQQATTTSNNQANKQFLLSGIALHKPNCSLSAIVCGTLSVVNV